MGVGSACRTAPVSPGGRSEQSLESEVARAVRAKRVIGQPQTCYGSEVSTSGSRTPPDGAGAWPGYTLTPLPWEGAA